MANQEHVDLLNQGVEQWNKWREQNQDIRPDLIGANLELAELRWVNLRETHLSAANLYGADLSRADLYQADLSEADLSRAYLARADLTLATLSRANLRGANLSEADLCFANLSGTDLSRASIFYTVFAHVDLSKTKGLAEIEHEGPSHVALDTIQLPQDGTAVHFLRGAGVPDGLLGPPTKFTTLSPNVLRKRESGTTLSVPSEWWSRNPQGSQLSLALLRRLQVEMM
jgi:hypothetical protein